MKFISKTKNLTCNLLTHFISNKFNPDAAEMWPDSFTISSDFPQFSLRQFAHSAITVSMRCSVIGWTRNDVRWLGNKVLCVVIYLNLCIDWVSSWTCNLGHWDVKDMTGRLIHCMRTTGFELDATHRIIFYSYSFSDHRLMGLLTRQPQHAEKFRVFLGVSMAMCL